MPDLPEPPVEEDETPTEEFDETPPTQPGQRRDRGEK